MDHPHTKWKRIVVGLLILLLILFSGVFIKTISPCFIPNCIYSSPTIGIDSKSNIHLIYFDWRNYELRYLRLNDNCEIETEKTIATHASAFEYCALLSSGGTIFVIYDGLPDLHLSKIKGETLSTVKITKWPREVNFVVDPYEKQHVLWTTWDAKMMYSCLDSEENFIVKDKIVAGPLDYYIFEPKFFNINNTLSFVTWSRMIENENQSYDYSEEGYNYTYYCSKIDPSGNVIESNIPLRDIANISVTSTERKFLFGNKTYSLTRDDYLASELQDGNVSWKVYVDRDTDIMVGKGLCEEEKRLFGLKDKIYYQHIVIEKNVDNTTVLSKIIKGQNAPAKTYGEYSWELIFILPLLSVLLGWAIAIKRRGDKLGKYINIGKIEINGKVPAILHLLLVLYLIYLLLEEMLPGTYHGSIIMIPGAVFLAIGLIVTTPFLINCVKPNSEKEIIKNFIPVVIFHIIPIAIFTLITIGFIGKIVCDDYAMPRSVGTGWTEYATDYSIIYTAFIGILTLCNFVLLTYFLYRNYKSVKSRMVTIQPLL